MSDITPAPSDSNIFVDHHVAKIAAALAPSPKDFRFIGITHGGARCACGTPIFVRFVLRAENPDREVIVGSTCIHATIPWLIRMDANGLAETIKHGWTEFVAAERRKKTTLDGEARLRELLPFAATLEMWARAIITTHVRSIAPIPMYWRNFIHGSLTAHDASTHGRRAAALARRMKRFADNVVGLEAIFASRKLAWTPPPERSSLPDEWFDMQMSAEELWRLARVCITERRYYQLITIVNRNKLMLYVRTPPPTAVDALSTWMADLRSLLEQCDAFIDESTRFEKNAAFTSILVNAEASIARVEPFHKYWPNIAGTTHVDMGCKLYQLEEELQKVLARFVGAKSNLEDLKAWTLDSREILASIPCGEDFEAAKAELSREFAAAKAAFNAR